MSVGIDFGTSNCSISVFDSGLRTIPIGSNLPPSWSFEFFENTFPSVFAFNEGDYLFGWQAKVSNKDVVAAVKRVLTGHEIIKLGSRQFSADAIAALLFQSLREMAEIYEVDASEAVVTIPSNVSARARHRTKKAAGQAGIRVKALIKEPTAAAIAYVYKTQEKPESLLVFDWGGGTVDATLLDSTDDFYDERVSVGQPVGGIEIDRRLGILVTNKLKRHVEYKGNDADVFKLSLERLKINLCATKDETEEVPIVLPDGVEVTVTRKEFEKDIHFLVESAISPVKRILDTLKLFPEQIDDFIMVGGSSNIPLAQKMLSEVMKSESTNFGLINPFTAVSEGAAVAAAQLDGKISGGYSVISDYSYFVKTHNKGKDAPEEMIPKGVSLPYKNAKEFVIKSKKEYQDLYIYEGNPPTYSIVTGHPDCAGFAILNDQTSSLVGCHKNRQLAESALASLIERVFIDSDSQEIGKFEIPNTSHAAGKESARVKIEFSFDRSGILHVTAFDAHTQNLVLKDKVDFYEETIGNNDAEINDVKLVKILESQQKVSSLMSKRAIDPAKVLKYNGPELIVDASNIAHIENDGKPKWSYVVSCVEALRQRHQGAPVTIFADANLRHKLDEKQRELMKLTEINDRIHIPPAGAKGKADYLILQYADARKGTIIYSNDSYKEFQEEFPWLREGTRLVGVNLVVDHWLFTPRTPPSPRRNS